MSVPHECPDLDLLERSASGLAREHRRCMAQRACHIYEGRLYCFCPEPPAAGGAA